MSGNSISIFRRTILVSGGRGFWFNPKSIQCHTLRVKSFTSLMVDLRQSKCFVKTPKWYEERRRSSFKENKWLGHKIVCNPTFNLLCGILHIFRMSKYMIHMFKETFSKPNLIYYYITPCKNNWHHKIEKVQFLQSFCDMILQTRTHLSTCWAYIEIANSDTKGLAKKSKLVLKICRLFFFFKI